MPDKELIMGELSKLGKTVLMAVIITAIVLWTFAVMRDLPGKVESNAQTIRELKENKVDKNVYNTDMCYIKETLSEIKSDVKEIKKGNR
jgi:hypothetical protein